MSLVNDIQTYLVEMQALAQLQADLVKENLVPRVDWVRLEERTERLRKRVEASIDRKRREEEKA